jgi:hypothetical protein
MWSAVIRESARSSAETAGTSRESANAERSSNPGPGHVERQVLLGRTFRIQHGTEVVCEASHVVGAFQ